jgi:hypothetical protein
MDKTDKPKDQLVRECIKVTAPSKDELKSSFIKIADFALINEINIDLMPIEGIEKNSLSKADIRDFKRLALDYEERAETAEGQTHIQAYRELPDDYLLPKDEATPEYEVKEKTIALDNKRSDLREKTLQAFYEWRKKKLKS